MVILRQGREIRRHQQGNEHIDEGQNADNARQFTQLMNHLITQHRNNNNNCTE